MTSAMVTALRRGRAVDPTRVLAGPLRGLGLSWLEPGEAIALAAETSEHALYVAAGSGLASEPDTRVPLAEGTSLTVPLGTGATLLAGAAGLEYFHAAPSGRPEEGKR